MNVNQTEGSKSIPVLFEKMDGVWLHMQDEHHKKMKKQEMKVFTIYEGWDAEKEKEKLNGDGGSWIKEPYDADVIFQLDRYHIYQEILRDIKDKKAQKEIRELFEAEKIEEMMEYIEVYATSVESLDEKNNESKHARELLQYLRNNKHGLLPYDKQGIKIPEPSEGILYKHMGVQESQNCTVITMRMNHRRMRWSKAGANNLAKALYRKENKLLINTIEHYTDGLIFTL